MFSVKYFGVFVLLTYQSFPLPMHQNFSMLLNTY